MRRASVKLVGSGVRFVDASSLFDEVSEAVFSDNCCHYNQRGNDLLADQLVDALTAVLGDL